LQLNFPITNNNKNSSNHNLVATTATSLSSVLISSQSFLPVPTGNGAKTLSLQTLFGRLNYHTITAMKALKLN
jgi:hypothetical protein